MSGSGGCGLEKSRLLSGIFHIFGSYVYKPNSVLSTPMNWCGKVQLFIWAINCYQAQAALPSKNSGLGLAFR
tara:strand:- start:68676 stop:68891 length:216 start_codon:yes stop_codon:yes gene_type:complete